MGKELGALFVILFGCFFQVASREACHDYYQGQQWRPAWCSQFCCGTHSYKYCCDDCRESIYEHSCERPREVEVPHYSNEVMFIAGVCGVTGVGIVIVFCTVTLIIKHLLKTGRGRRRRSRSPNSGHRPDLDFAIPQGVAPGEKSKMLPPPLYDSTDTAPSGITPPPAYMPIVSPGAISRALVRISLNYPALLDDSRTSHNRTRADQNPTVNIVQPQDTTCENHLITQDLMTQSPEHDNSESTSSRVSGDHDNLSEYRRMAEIEQVLVTALTLPPPYQEVEGERF